MRYVYIRSVKEDMLQHQEYAMYNLPNQIVTQRIAIHALNEHLRFIDVLENELLVPHG